MRILSLFDGMACGMIAMLLAGVPVESYDAYEIDKYAIKVATHNFPNIKEHGDVFEADFTQYEGVDFLVGGSPCTYWSIAQTKNRETVASGMGWELFSQYVRALKEAKPKYFIYENNKSMSKQIRASIDDAFGFEAICINSALVSAQNRQRLYWVGKRNADGTYSRVNVEQPADRGILLKDVLDNAVAMREKAHAVIASAGRTTEREFFMKNQGEMVAEPVPLSEREMDYMVRDHQERRWNFCNRPGEKDKSECITANIHKGVPYNVVAEPVRGMGNDTKSRTLTANYWKTNVRDAFVDCAGGRTMVAEPVCLRYERTEEAKRCRKAYEAHEIKHGYNELNELHPRPDGKTNTLTTVLKDNQIMEPVCVAERGRMYCGQPQHYEARTDGKTNTLTSVEKYNRVAEPINVTEDGKSQTLKAQYCKNSVANFCCYSSTYGASGVAEPVACRCRGRVDASGNGYAKYECREDGKSNTLDTNTTNGAMVAEPINMTADGKAQCLRATCYKDGIRNIVANEVDKKTGVAEPINDICQVGAMPRPDGEISTSAGFRIYSTEAKGRYLCANGGGAGAKTGLYAIPYANEFDDEGRPIKAIGKDGKEITIYEVRDGKITIKGKQYPIKLKDGYYKIRKLTVSECKRLQTVPEWYDFSVISNSQAFKCLGNGWTCQIICHLINSCFKPADALPGQMCLWG